VNRVDGLLLKLIEDGAGFPGRWFWKLFRPIRQDLDRLYWCFSNQPWMGAPSDFREDDLEPFEEEITSSIQLWRPGSLTRYAGQFGEEQIELWAIEPTRDDPAQLATKYSASGWSHEVIREHARVWLIYTDSTCWEIYARKRTLRDKVEESLQGKRWVEVYRGNDERRGELFGMAGLSHVWRALNGRFD
jgi:hypothetical protein